jgi:thiamine pyrophosphate-dependent acetolactate synthase large subunit-like protein
LIESLLTRIGWNAPRKSLLLVHPEGLGSKATNEELNISFAPVPDYAGIAKAAAGGELFAEKASDLEDVLTRAIESVKNGTTAVIDAVVKSGC